MRRLRFAYGLGYIAVVALIAAVMGGCKREVRFTSTDNLPDIFPDYKGVTIPASMAVDDGALFAFEMRNGDECRAERSRQGDTIWVEVCAWQKGSREGVRYKALDGKLTPLKLKLIYPETNGAGPLLADTFANHLAQAGIASVRFDFDGTPVELTKDDLLIEMTQKEGYVSMEDYGITTVLDTKLTKELVDEGIVNEVISKLQNMRKDSGFEVMDRIDVSVTGSD